MKIRYAVILIALCIILVIAGAFVKILHISEANEFLIIGGIFEIMGLSLLLFAALKNLMVKETMEW